MQGSKERKRSTHQEVISFTQKAHKHQNTRTNLGNFQKDVLCRTVFEYNDRGEPPAAKKVTFSFREKYHLKVQLLPL
jgi:hypothetical protein